MKLPQEAITLPGGIHVPVRTVQVQSFQYHVVKHPLGVDRNARAGSDDPEGWGTLTPPVVQPGERQAIFSNLAGAGCGLPEVRGKKAKRAEAAKYACWECPEPTARACAASTEGEQPVGLRYAAAIEGAVRALEDGVVVPRSACLSAIVKNARTAGGLSELAVLTVGMAGGSPKPLMRIRTGAGLNVEFSLHESGEARVFRTCYRHPGTGIALVCFFTQGMLAKVKHPLSEMCLVTRPFWEAHGT